MSHDINVTTWVKHNGIEYHPGLVVCTDMLNEMPVFKKIVSIFLRKEMYFLVSEMETSFVEHFHVFQVVDNIHHFSIVTPHDLRYFKPFDVQMSYGTDLFFSISQNRTRLQSHFIAVDEDKPFFKPYEAINSLNLNPDLLFISMMILKIETARKSTSSTHRNGCCNHHLSNPFLTKQNSKISIFHTYCKA